MSTTINCDQCQKPTRPDRRIEVKNLCLPHGIMLAQNLDFCDSKCFWTWVGKWIAEARVEVVEPK